MGVKRESKELVDEALQGGSTHSEVLEVAMLGLSSRLGKPEWGCRCCCWLGVDLEP